MQSLPGDMREGRGRKRCSCRYVKPGRASAVSMKDPHASASA